MFAKIGDLGEGVGLLQRRLTRAGFPVAETHVYDKATEKAVMALQAARGLVVDGIAGPKTFVALSGVKLDHHLTAADLEKAAATLGVDLAVVRAVNEVESKGHGMPPEGKAVILFERHVFWKRLVAHGIDPAPAAVKWPGIVSRERGGYHGGSAEYVRLGTACTIDRAAALESCSWGAFQIMGYHWKILGYASVEEFVELMNESEGQQLEAFVRLIAHEKALLAALKARKWSTFARLYNGPDYAANLYDVKLARAYAKYAVDGKAAA